MKRFKLFSPVDSLGRRDSRSQVISVHCSPRSPRCTPSKLRRRSNTLHPSPSIWVETRTGLSSKRMIFELSSTAPIGIYVGFRCIAPSQRFQLTTLFYAATSVTLDPVLHFMLFVPSQENRPMRISTSRTSVLASMVLPAWCCLSADRSLFSGSKPSSNAFITPQRGGVVIFNPPSAPHDADPSSPLSLASDSLDTSFQLFEQQLRKLLGVPQPPRSARYGRTGALEGWQVDAMVRTRLAEATKESVDTLHAIVKLVDDIPNMRVGKEVQRGVYSALKELDQVGCSASAPVGEARRPYSG